MDSQGPDGSVLEQEVTPPLPPQRQQSPKGSGLRGLFFSSSPAEEEPSPPAPAAEELLEEAATARAVLEEHADESVSGPAWPSGEPADQLDDDPTSSPATTRAERRPFSSVALRRTFRRGVLIAGGMAHQALARTQGQRQVGLYETDKEDAENIGDPLSRIAGRRGGIGGAVANPDVEDAVSALLGMANFVTKQVVKASIAAKIDAGEDISHLIAVEEDAA